MIDVGTLPTVNAALNATATVLLLAGYRFIRRRDVAKHRACMVAALIASAAFLTSYLIYHYHAGSRPFTGAGLVRSLYFFILITHVVLAAVNVPMILVTVTRAFRGDLTGHRRLARWTFPVWLYVSVTGVVVYLMLYHL